MLTRYQGLASPGIFKAFWHAQSQSKQRKLLVLFLTALDKSPKLGPDNQEIAPTPLEIFETTLRDASPHDVAELFKWGIRHFKFEGSSFGSSSEEYGWYTTFATNEKSASYPQDAYSQILLPLLPDKHQELLNVLFDASVSIAAYSEANGLSGITKYNKL